jgi:hypothetical protein
MGTDNYVANMEAWRNYINKLIDTTKQNMELYQGRRYVKPPDLSEIFEEGEALNLNTFESLQDEVRNEDRITLEMRNHDQVAATARLKAITELTRKDYYMNAQLVARHHVAYLQLLLQSGELHNIRCDVDVDDGSREPVIDVFSGEELE